MISHFLKKVKKKAFCFHEQNLQPKLLLIKPIFTQLITAMKILISVNMFALLNLSHKAFAIDQVIQDQTVQKQATTPDSSNGAQTTKKDLFIVCNKNSEVRYLRVFSLANDGKCRTVYSKEGFTQVISSATYYSSCEAVLLNVKKNIEDGGFKCESKSLASITEL